VDLQATRPEVTPDGLSFSISGMGITDRSTPLSLSGLHNVENLLAATAAVLSTGADPAALQSGFASISLPPGRLERVGPEGLGYRCLVDYAHTPDALRATLSSLREEVDVTEGARLICVFGCGGDRDRGKRPEMGATVTGLADLAIVTSDNPRTEDPHSIIDDVLTGCRGGRAEVQVEADRRRAICSALESARNGDIVLIAGKGHEADPLRRPRGREGADRMISLTFRQLLDATGARAITEGFDTSLRGVSTDSRAVEPGQLFVALSGPNFDGNEFAKAAIKAGASAILLREGGEGEISQRGTARD
jgi:UDP-N-acetylmuramyl tripeptide synthase